MHSCSGSKFPGKGPTNHSGCNFGKGGGSDCYGDSGFVRDHIGFLPFPKGYSASAPLATLPRLDPSRIVFAPDPGDPSEKWGTQDPQCAYDPYSEQYFLSYTAWAGPSAGWAQKAAVSKHPSDKNSWRRLGPTFTPNNSWPVTPKGAESNIKCSALYATPDPRATPRYYLYSVSTRPTTTLLQCTVSSVCIGCIGQSKSGIYGAACREMSHSLGRVSLPAIRFPVHGRDESRWQAGAQCKGSGIITWAALSLLLSSVVRSRVIYSHFTTPTHQRFQVHLAFRLAGRY